MANPLEIDAPPHAAEVVAQTTISDGAVLIVPGLAGRTEDLYPPTASDVARLLREAGVEVRARRRAPLVIGGGP